MLNKYDNEFWSLHDRMVAEHEIVVDRLKNSRHPKYPDYVYPLDYGDLKGTTSSDGGGIDMWIGSSAEKKVTAIISSVDYLKGDSEIKILYACTPDEIELVDNTHNRTSGMKGVLTIR